MPDRRRRHRLLRRPRRLAAGATAGALALLAVAPLPAHAGVAAVRPDNRPTPLAGVDNGHVPADRLVTVAPGCRVAREAGPSLALLFRMAARAGVRLGARDCYRPLDGQLAAAAAWTARGNSACAAAPATHPDGRPRGTSTHGWGKAVDVSEPGRVTFSSPGYRFLTARAAAVGWNHPGWAAPGGGPCPEPWHWEWVGDGGALGGDAVRADVVALLAAPDDRGYASVTGLGAVRPRGSARSSGGADAVPVSWVVVGAAA
ncbi:MAG TPA: M15 family metallopeptidase, partial [Acidimicrobiales bacterium]|nr:M15 family metallopeptidase [Acidimicrobiales bacterium]